MFVDKIACYVDATRIQKIVFTKYEFVFDLEVFIKNYCININMVKGDLINIAKRATRLDRSYEQVH